MAKRPQELIYAVNEKPPFLVMLVMGLQHIFVMSSTLVLPVVILQEIGGSFIEIRNIVSLSMIAAGIGTILQALGKGVVGSGYLIPNLCGPSFLSVSIHAAWIGGLPLMRGMTIIAGLFEALFSRIVHRLTSLFPTEITGLVVLMVGVTLVPLGASKFVGINYSGDVIMLNHVFVAMLTLITMIGVNIWSKGKIKLYCVFIGMVVGYLLSYITGILTPLDFENVLHAPLFSIPFAGIEHFKFAFDWSLVIPFSIVSLCGSLKSFGNLITAQKINDAEWKQANMKNIGNGLFADSLSVVSAGLLGGMATDTSASNVGMSLATKATSRWIGFAAGTIFIFLGFFPKLASIISIMPSPIMGAILIFVVTFMVLSGFQIILTGDLTTRKIFIIGISFIFGLSVDILPELYTHILPWLRPVFASSLTLSTVLAIILNQIFNIGASQDKSN
jgi:NCS2 family nucleobase:cation symporter-2